MACYFRFVNKTILYIAQLFLAHAQCPIGILLFDRVNHAIKVIKIEINNVFFES